MHGSTALKKHNPPLPTFVPRMFMIEPQGVHHLVFDVSDEVGALPYGDGLGQGEGPVRATDLGEASAAVQEFHVGGLGMK